MYPAVLTNTNKKAWLEESMIYLAVVFSKLTKTMANQHSSFFFFICIFFFFECIWIPIHFNSTSFQLLFAITFQIQFKFRSIKGIHQFSYEWHTWMVLVIRNWLFEFRICRDFDHLLDLCLIENGCRGSDHNNNNCQGSKQWRKFKVFSPSF